MQNSGFLKPEKRQDRKKECTNFLNMTYMSFACINRSK